MPSDNVEERFWKKVEPMMDDRGCWEWLGYFQQDGYGRIKSEGRKKMAHRVSYEMYVGAIPDGLQIDHLCRNRSCVNPRHLEVVTGKINTLRGNAPSATNAIKTHCINGHPFDESNTRVYRDDWGVHRKCVICDRARSKRRWSER